MTLADIEGPRITAAAPVMTVGTRTVSPPASTQVVCIGVQRFDSAYPFDGQAVDGVFVADADRQHPASACVEVCVDQPETPSRVTGHVELSRWRAR